MDTSVPEYRHEVLAEFEKIPAEFLPALLAVVRAFRESVTLPDAQTSFRQGLSEALSDQSRPVSDLWEDLDAG